MNKEKIKFWMPLIVLGVLLVGTLGVVYAKRIGNEVGVKISIEVLEDEILIEEVIEEPIIEEITQEELTIDEEIKEEEVDLISLEPINLKDYSEEGYIQADPKEEEKDILLECINSTLVVDKDKIYCTKGIPE